MNLNLIWDNLVTYSLQVGLLVAIAAFLPAVLRLRVPGAKLAFWQLLLAACLLLPLVRPWRQQVANDQVDITTTILAVAPAQSQTHRLPSKTEMALGLLALGAVLRVAWLGIGLIRLRYYRRRSTPWLSNTPFPTLLSPDVASPVTFGFRNPVVLLPERFPALDRRMQDAILCHELLHIERNDWLFTLFEELIRAVFWFHPAIWWLLGEIQLAREQAVDHEVVYRTQARDEYVDALLAIAGAGAQAELAPAPLFLRRRHLKQRVVSILKEVRMSKKRWVSALAAALGFLVGACWFVTGTFPLAATPQRDAPGVSIDLGGAALMHRAPVQYPESARRNNIQGTVTVEVKIDSNGGVADARVISGPEELRKAVLSSVLQWHFAASAAGTSRTVNIGFQAAEANAAKADQRSTVGAVGGVPGGVVGGVPGGVNGGIPSVRVGRPQPNPGVPGVLKGVNINGLPDQAAAELRAKLPVNIGEPLSTDMTQKVADAVSQFDEHLRVSYATFAGDVFLNISAPDYIPDTPQRIKVAGAVQQSKLVSQPHPVYPPEAKQAGVQGLVRLMAIVGKDGTIQKLEVVEGPPLLVPAAMDAVRQWVYQPTLLNGDPVEIQTQIDVNFTLTK